MRRWLVVAIMMAVGAGSAAGAPAGGPVLYEEHFRGGPQLAWQSFPDFAPDSIGVVQRADAPDGDGWVGRVTNAALGGFASLAYAGDPHLADYSVEAWVYVDAVGDQHAPLQGLAIRVDPVERRFYRLAAQFGAEARITLAYVGRDVSNFPIYLRTWTGAAIPGGVPRASGWHRMMLRVVDDQIQASWDGQELPGGPVADGRIPRGAFGVYATYTGGEQVIQTLVDALVVRAAR